ncbi:Ig-like domain-containing protein [candidate division KSB1 bacterium]|nr:Ig-like domain-containing protein [candidate division KSB1 bacterium]
MSAANDPEASNGRYISTRTYNEGLAKYNFWICQGTYDLILRVYAPSSTSNSIFFAMDDPAKLGEDASRLEFDVSTNWVWSNKARSSNIFLSEGFHTLYLRGRESDTRIDKILFTSHSGFIPSGVGGSTPKFANVTDNKGIVSTDITFGRQAGEVIIEATSNAVPAPYNYVEFSAIRVNGGTPATFIAESSTIIQGEAGKELLESFAVQVSDAYGNSRQGEQVIFAVVKGDGRFSGSEVAKANTDENGVAEASLKLGYEPETVIDAYLNDFANIEHITFKGVAAAGTIPFELVRLSTKDHFEVQVNSPVPEPLRVQVLNQAGLPYSDYPVEFKITAGDGKLNGLYASIVDSTDADGIAEVTWTIGKIAGVNAHIVRINATLNGAPMEFTTTALPDEPYKLAKLGGDNQRQGAGKTFADSLTIQIQDQYGNGIPDYPVRFSVVPGNGDGNFDGRTGVSTSGAAVTLQTNAKGFAGVLYTAGTIKGENQIIAEGMQQPQLPSKNHTIFYLTVDPPLPQSIAIVSGQNQTKEVSTELAPFKVKIYDPFDNGIGADIRVKFQVTKGISQFNNAAIYETRTDASGVAAAIMTLGQSAGEQRARVTLLDYPDVAPVEFSVMAIAGPAAKLKRVSPQQFSEKAGGLVTLTVQVTDTYDNVKSGHAVLFTVNAGGGVFKEPAGSTVTVTSNSENGYASVTYQMGRTTSILNEITASAQQIGGAALKDSPIHFQGLVLPGAPTIIEKESSDYKRGSVASTIAEPYVAQLRDANDNPVASLKVAFVAKSVDAQVDGRPSIEKTTDAEGRVSVIYKVGTKAKIDTLQMSAVGYDLSNYYLIIAEPGNPAKMAFDGDSLWQATLGSIPFQVTPRVKVVDSYGNLIDDAQPVKFQITQGSSSLLPGTVQEMTQNTINGLSQVTWQLGTTPQQHRLRATSTYNGAALASSPLYFTAATDAGAPEHIRLVQPDSNYIYATANQPLLLRIQVTDRWENAVVNAPVNFTVELPESNKGVLIDANGKEWTDLTINSDGQGFAQLFFKPVITTTIVNRIRISVERGNNLPAIKEWVHVFGEAPLAKRIQILGSKQITVQANSKVNVQVAAYDATNGGSRVPNHTIWFSVSKGDGHLQSSGSQTSTRPTNSEGVAEEIWNVGPTIGRGILLINGNTQVGSPDSIIATVQPAAPFADSSRLAVLNEMIAGVKSIVKLTLVDSYNNPVSGYEFILNSPNQGVSFEQPSAPTGSDGATYGTVTSTQAGAIEISAEMKSNSSFRIPPIVVSVTHGAAAKIELVGQNNQFVGNIGAILKEPLAVRVTDSYGNRVSANKAEVKFSLVNGGGSFEGENASKNNAFVRTDSLGIARIQLVMGPQANEAYLIEASLSDPNNPNIKLTFIGQSRRPVLPLTLHKVSGDSLTGKVGETLKEAFVTRVQDKDGLPVWSENNPIVRFASIIGAGQFVDGEFVNADKYGAASTRYKFTTGGTHTIRAFIPTGNTEVQFTAFAQAGAPSKLLPVENTTQEYRVKSALNSIKVMVTDADGNPVDDIPVSFTLLSEPQQSNGAFVDSAPVKTGANGEPGIARASMTLGGKMGSYVVVASSTLLSASEKVTFTINATPAEAYYLNVHSGDQQFGTKNRKLVFPIIIRVTDEFLNPVPDIILDFWADAARGHGQPMFPTAKTEANGLATNWWTIGNSDQSQMIVQKIGLRPSTLTVTAFGVTNNFPEFKNMPMDTAIFTKREWVLPFYAEDKDGDPLTYTITAGLPGASFDAQRAILRWTPTQVGQWTMHYRVDDNKPAPQRGFDVDSIKITVLTPIEIISSYPQDNLIKIPYDQEQEFGVVATGTNIMYKWVLNGTIVQNSNVSRYTIKASDYPRGALHSLTVTAYDASHPLNADVHSWGVRTKVELTSFSGESAPFRGVELNWRTSHEDGNVGFDVLRSTAKSGVFAKITDKLITSTTGAYAFTDTSVVAGHTYYYKLEDFDIGGQRTQSEAIVVTVDIPRDFMLLQNYPNPFNPRTTIRFQLPQAVDTKVVIYNINGQVVNTVLDGRKDAGYYEIHWSGQNNAGVQVSSGVYYVRMQAGDFQATKKMLLVR